ncbi:unnamed protein product, partial [Tuber aestivum]
MIEPGYHRPHTRFKMSAQMGLVVSSVREEMSHDGCPNFPGEPYTADNAETTVIENHPQCRLLPSQVQKLHVTPHSLSGSSETRTSSSHLMGLPFVGQLIHNLPVSSRLHAAGHSTTYPSKCTQSRWSPSEATSAHGLRCHRVNGLCFGTTVSFSDGITSCTDVSPGGCRSCVHAIGDSNLNREFGMQSSVAEGPSKGRGSAAGSKTGGSEDANLFASYMLFWLIPLAVSTSLVAALGIPHGARAGALLNSTGEFVVSKSPPRLRTPALWLLPLFPSAFQSPYTLEQLYPSSLESRLSRNLVRANCSETFCQLRLPIPTTWARPIAKMSSYNQSTHAPPGEDLLGPDQADSYFESEMRQIAISGYGEPSPGYTTYSGQDLTAIPLQPVSMEDLLTFIPPSATPHTSPGTLYDEPQWPFGGGLGSTSPENYFSSPENYFSSPENCLSSPNYLSSPENYPSSPGNFISFDPSITSPSPADTPASATPSSGDRAPRTPPQSPSPPEPSPPPLPTPEPLQKPDGTWACPEPGCPHPGHKRRCDARKHHKSHTKPYPCRRRGCDYRSSNAKDRERHYDTRHAKITDHPLCPAPGCGVHKSRVDNMRDHIRRKHPEMDHRSPGISALYPRRRGRR